MIGLWTVKLTQLQIKHVNGKTKPKPAQSSILWGDCRCANVMYDPDGQVSAVLDWEMAALGDPCMDLAWGIAIDDCNSKGVRRKVGGFPGPIETIAKWEVPQALVQTILITITF